MPGTISPRPKRSERIGVGVDPAIEVDMQSGERGGNLAAILRRVDGDEDEADRLAGVRRRNLLEAGQLFLAWAAPGSPEVHHHNLAVERGKLARLPIECLESGIGRVLGQQAELKQERRPAAGISERLRDGLWSIAL